MMAMLGPTLGPTVGPTLGVDDSMQLFDSSPDNPIGISFDVAPDDHFLMTRPVGAATARPDDIILVENFFADLRAKLKSR